MRRLGIPRSRLKQFHSTVEALNTSLYGLIAERRGAPSAGDDILGMLLQALGTRRARP